MNTIILTLLALSGVMFISTVEAGGMSMGNQNGPQSAYGPGPGYGYGPGGNDSGFGMGNRP